MCATYSNIYYLATKKLLSLDFFYRKLINVCSHIVCFLLFLGLSDEKNQSGRSMVEMLGVLAIIGVLSVGAIAGYSKAMTKYKLNKQSEQLTQLVTALYKYKAQWKFDGSKIVDLIPYYEKLG